ncbi:hypothetical protein WA158_002853 [Blastocystis sp. Blastoise]
MEESEDRYICDKCLRWVKYTDMTEEDAKKIHDRHCEPMPLTKKLSINDKSDADPLDEIDPEYQIIALSDYMQSDEYRDSQKWDPNGEWCRYCGAKKASGWYKGPWGPKTLCTVHYVQWKQRKTLSLDKCNVNTDKPINIAANSESGYLERMAHKHSSYALSPTSSSSSKLQSNLPNKRQTINPDLASKQRKLL